MKKTCLLILSLISLNISAQNITWQNVNINVPFENTDSVYNLIDGFYSNIQIPEGVRVSYGVLNIKAQGKGYPCLKFCWLKRGTC